MSSPKEITPGFRITAIWAFIAIDDDGDEGIPAFISTMSIAGLEVGAPMPMICADQSRVDSLREIAKKIAQERGIRIELVKFGGQRETMEIFDA